ncbi:SDR family NAD(P)-dependent oxidoreductase [Hyphobacterium sp.]|uniref:SDR family NAD(P)-dependent oxidoreductase n=1 Tax=Hyphobacterium sp. TaxID=2004662 RepID=UPI003BAC8BC3
MLENLPDNFRAVIFGASGGIGAAFRRALEEDGRCAALYVGGRQLLEEGGKTRSFTFDLTDEASIAASAEMIGEGGQVHLVLVPTGILHGKDFGPERSWRELNAETMTVVFAINTIGPALIAKHALELLPRDEPSIFAALSARVGSIGDNSLGGWHSYRASKAALNMLIRNFSIELKRKKKQSLCVSLHPGTVDTGLSEPFQRGVPEGKLFTPDYSARQLLSVLCELTPDQTGQSFAWDGQVIEW